MRLFRTTGVEEQWRVVVLPWLREKAAAAWRDARPTVVLTPSRAESFYLRSRLVEEEFSFFGLRFWTPSDLRAFLLGETPLEAKPATESELRLVARISAEKLAQKSDELAGVEREPGLFLHAYDLLLGAGWSAAKEGAAYGRGLAREMERQLKDRKIVTQAGLHRLLRQEGAKRKEPLLADLLLAGFNAAHWPLWDLLRAAVVCAEKATLSFPAPRAFGGEIDQLWIGSWEEELGESAEFPEAGGGEVVEPFSGWVGSYERGDSISTGDCDFTFLASSELETQVQAIVLQTLTYLSRDSCRRLGLVFPEANALSLDVADELRRLGVPLDDGTGYLQPGIFERRTWAAWLALQEEPSVQRVIAWVRAGEAEGLDLEISIPARELADLIDEGLGETLIDDLSFLGRYLERKAGRAREAGRFLRSLVQLPEKGTFAEFWILAGQAWKTLGGIDHASLEPPSWLREAGWIMNRRTFLAWLKESADSRERTRGAEGNHFYGRVHLLIYAQMPGQTWSHLILTGLSEGKWPRMFETGAFGSRYELAELNRQARLLNRKVVRQGSQGEGHEAVRPDRGHCLLPIERHDLALRDLCAAVEATTEAVCFSALSAEAGRALLPSDFFAQAYQAKTGRALDEISLAALVKSTADWCQAGLLRPREKSGARVETTRSAYAARRDPAKPFGPFQFAFATPPKEPIQLACKTWETAWFHPAAVWLEKIVGVSAWPEGELGWSRAVGTWVHRWMTASLKTCRETGDPSKLPALLRAAAEEERRRLAHEAGAALNPWWRHVWGHARAVALGLGGALVPELKERLFLSEFRLPGRTIALPGTAQADFDLRGQIDLLLIEPAGLAFDPAKGDFSGCGCWVIDFKTGSAKNLTAGQIEKGVGLQAMLYALAVRSAGAMSVALSLQTFDAPLLPQAQVEQVEANVTLFRELDRLHRQGIFGERPAPGNDYGFAPVCPIATRPIEAGVLEAKWALTHGAVVLEEEP